MVQCSEIKVIKKDGTREDFNVQKVVAAVGKSAERAMIRFSDGEIQFICRFVEEKAESMDTSQIPIAQMHNIVEGALEQVNPAVAKSYRDYRNYKQDFVEMLDDVYKKSQSIMYIGDKENSNTDSALVSTKRSLIFNELNKSLYQKFFMPVEDLQDCREGYIYIHDMSARRDTMNCCLFDVQSVLSGGFEMGNLWYNEPKTLDVAFDVIGDIVLSAASQQYGGFTVPNVENILAPYAEKSYEKYIKKYEDLGLPGERAREVALEDVQREMEQGFQGWEYKFNSVSSSRGDYPFITMTAGTGTSRFAKMATITMLKVRGDGEGKPGHKKPVLFPKLVFLYDEKLHGPGGELEDVFEAGIECSSKTMYPDWLSLTGEGYVPSMYKKYGNYVHTVESFSCEGAAGMDEMTSIMQRLHSEPPAEICGFKVVRVDDYVKKTSKDTVTGEETPIALPKSDVLTLTLENKATVIIRPSGTEPKIKAYYTTVCPEREEAVALGKSIAVYVKKLLGF